MRGSPVGSYLRARRFVLTHSLACAWYGFASLAAATIPLALDAIFVLSIMKCIDFQ
jgi:hypothetical protein